MWNVDVKLFLFKYSLYVLLQAIYCNTITMVKLLKYQILCKPKVTKVTLTLTHNEVIIYPIAFLQHI